MRILSAITGLTITAVTAVAAVTSLSLTPAPVPAPADVTLSAFVSTLGPVKSDCDQCGTSDNCHHCIGTGAAGGNLKSGKSCPGCGGTGTCQHCLDPEPLTLIKGGKD